MSVSSYELGPFRLKPDAGVLTHAGGPVALGARGVAVLTALVSRAGEYVGKAAIMDAAWPGLVVEENNLAAQISAIRRALARVPDGEDWIETLARRGYRYVGPVVEIAGEPVSPVSADREPAHAAVPAPPPLQGPKHNLPAQMASFIGRENEIRAIKEQLSNANVRLLTLSGVGGTGKTRLALQAAAHVVEDFEHGVFFVPLAALSDPALVLPTIAKAFDVHEAAGRSLQEQLQDYLREKQMLLMLDNFEQVIAAATLVTALLTAAPRLKVLVTSREVLRLSGETDYPVPSLSLPDPKRLPPLERFTQYEAVALFIERAVAVKLAFRVTDDNALAIAEICHRLDGLPLAIELAAARVRVLPPQRMLAELSHRLSFLMAGARDLPARQRTLRGAIDWSYDLLTGDEQRLFRRLAVFVGGCALEAIEAVCNVENDLNVLEIVESLVGKSLVKQTDADGGPRFAMLETIREYAGDRLLAAGEAERVRERHRDTFLALAEEAEPKLMGAEQAEWLRRLEEEHENLRASLDWSLAEAGSEGGLRLCGALARFWFTRGHLAEGRQWCARVLSKAGGDERTSERAKALYAASGMAHFQGDYPAARARLEESLAIRRELGDRSGIARSLNTLGSVALEQGDFASARALLDEAMAMMRELGDRWGIARSIASLGNVAHEQGDFVSAQALHEESLAIWRELGNRRGIAHSLNNLGNAAYVQGVASAARALYVESVAISVELGERRAIAYSLEGLAEVVAGLGSSLRAARIWGAAGRLREEIGSPLRPNKRPGYDRRVAAARKALGDDVAFDRAWYEGRALTLEQAIELALKPIAPTLDSQRGDLFLRG